jgi:HPt (histidine-containing phosphotransfer) domain-containing protein
MPSEFIDRFVADSSQRIADLRQALSSADLPAAGGLAHTLIGGAGIVGARPMAEAAQRVQTFTELGDIAAARQGYESLVAEFLRVKALFSAASSDQSSSDQSGDGSSDEDDEDSVGGRIRPTSTSQV